MGTRITKLALHPSKIQFVRPISCRDMVFLVSYRTRNVLEQQTCRCISHYPDQTTTGLKPLTNDFPSLSETILKPTIGNHVLTYGIPKALHLAIPTPGRSHHDRSQVTFATLGVPNTKVLSTRVPPINSTWHAYYSAEDQETEVHPIDEEDASPYEHSSTHESDTQVGEGQ
ncbi:uncharacterized protein MELLADRAFT_114752 [Melampsora larici-populina 98AG31]|uniref:Uncharacterized protein n=1 Tax=Melampsora larici-populina (strain 98AG31 / pathotype 3-4-7) TaxID=747676 RepID=F4SEM3_MELLP|nr:uncharacterized protein MELLADRAFT_114752 [Melampsora larici-populina 98AG31]EGF96903.1 hypothetical protein MELLADRAFT_114752 [Melampsora larici-populina 98AG31]